MADCENGPIQSSVATDGTNPKPIDIVATQEEKETPEDDALWKSLCLEHNKFVAENPNLRCSAVDKTVDKAVQARNIRALGSEKNVFKMSPDNYDRSFRLLLQAEEAYDHIGMRRYDQLNAKVRRSLNRYSKYPLFEYDLKGLSKGKPNIIPTDTVVLDDGVQINRFTIRDIIGDTVIFGGKRYNEGSLEIDTNRRYKISFVQGGITYDRYSENLKEVRGNKQLEAMLFEDKGRSKKRFCELIDAKIDLEATKGEIVDQRLAKCNTRQRQAIQNILEARCRPKPYILFGPPGTGKSFTVIETVIQIFKRNPKARILVTASSNNCVDDLATKVVGTGQISKFIRFSSMTHFRTLTAVPSYYTTDLEKMKKYRLVFTTNMMTCKLKRPFDYVLVDEAGHAHIPDSMLPMSRVARDGCFVLAGDPKQLGPVVKCHGVQKLGLGVSLLERLFKFGLYKRTSDGTHDAKYITKLNQSYRCDPRILELCNKLFYHGDLECLGKTPPSILRMLKAKRPLVFSEVWGKEYTPKQSTSRCNMNEARKCIDYLFRLYLMGFEPHQIGIITPYELQKGLLIEIFDKRLKDFKSLLNDRFKLPNPPARIHKPEEEQSMESSREALKAEQHDRPINDLEFLAKALGQLQLQTEHTIEQANSSQVRVQYTDWHCKIDTVDAFQGNEREIIIMSTVRTPMGKDGWQIQRPGFLTDAKRFNVAISRSKWLVITVGHPAVLSSCYYWMRYGWSTRQKRPFTLQF